MSDEHVAATADTALADPSGAPSVNQLYLALELDKVSRALFDAPTPIPTFARYEVRSSLGRGGMGSVFEAFDPTLDRSVAIKVLHPDIAEQHSDRLVREAKALARLSHPNVVQVYEVGEHEGQIYISMELVRGETLAEWHAEPKPWREAVGRYLQAGRALSAAHERDLVHRDFKPGNCIVDEEGRVRVLDFGLVLAAGVWPSTGGSTPASATLDTPAALGQLGGTPPTAAGTVVGTLPYMAPEQLEGSSVDPRADQFSFCVALHEAIFGMRPVPGTTVRALVSALRNGERQPPPKGIAVPAALLRALQRGTDHDPDRRFASMDELLEALTSVVKPKRRGLVGGLTLGLAALGVAVLTRDTSTPPCTGADERIARVWNGDRREGLSAALTATNLPYAPQTGDRVMATLDSYATAWSEQHTDACEATAVRKDQTEAVQTLRMRCLDRAERALDGAIGLLEKDAASTIQRATRLLDALPDLAQCGDVEALALELPPPPEDKAARAEEIQQQLLHAAQLTEAGRYERARTVADDAAAEAEKLEYPPVFAEALVRRADARRREGDFEGTRSDLEQAHALAVELDHLDVQIRSTSSLCFVVATKLERPDEGKPWCSTAIALTKRRGVTPLQQLRARFNAARAQTKLGQAPADEAAELEALVEFVRSEPSLSRLREADVLFALAQARGRQSRLHEAVTLTEQVLAIRREQLGDRHPSTAMALHQLASKLEPLDELDAATNHLQEALSIYEEVFGPGHNDIGRIHFDWAAIEYRRGHPEQALEHYDYAHDAFAAALGPDSLGVAKVLLMKGGSLNRLGRHEESLQVRTDAADILRRRYGSDSRYLGDAEYAIATTLYQMFRYDESLEHYQEARRIFEASYGPDHHKMGELLNSMAGEYGRRGDHAEEAAVRRRAIEIATKNFGRRHHLTATFLHNLGMTLMEMDQLEEAKSALLEALEIREEKLGPEHEHVARSEITLAQLHLQAEDPAEAVPHARRSLAIREQADLDPGMIADARFVLAQALWHDPGQRTAARELAQAALKVYEATRGTEAPEPWLEDAEAWVATHPVP